MNPLTEHELANLIRVAWIVLVPGGVLLCMVLYKLAMLLHGLVEFLNLARYEMAPTLKDLRLTAENVEVLSAKAVHSVRTVEHRVSSTVPAIQSAGRNLASGLESFWSGVRASFSRKR
jgi:hypothetical protein